MEPYDDPEISDQDRIIRRLNPAQHIVPDHNTGRDRVSSKLFSPSSEPNGGMSVDFPKLMERDGVVVEEFVTTPVFTGSVVFPAWAVRSVDLWVGYEPISGNPYHGEVWRVPPARNFTNAQKKALMRASEWFVEIPGADIPRD
jgi:hypothetical protein